MKKYLGYEPFKFFHNPYPVILAAILFLLNVVNFKYITRNFSENYVPWLNASSAKNVFDYLLGKTAIFNGVILCLITLYAAYNIFFVEYNRGTMKQIYYSVLSKEKIFKQKILFFILLITTYNLLYVLLLAGFGIYLMEKYQYLIGGHYRFILGSIAEYSFVYVAFAFRSALFFSVFFKWFKASLSAISVFFLVHVCAMFVSWLPFNTIYTTDMKFEWTAFPAILYAVLFFTIDKNLKYANRIN